MTFDATYIDKIVQSVIREMKTRVTVAASAQVAAGQASCGQSPQRAGSDDQRSPVGQDTRGEPAENAPIQISGKVVSENVLVGANAAGKVIALPVGAIVTPSGKDFIRKNNITIAGSAAVKTAVVSTGTLIAIGANATCQSAAISAGWTACSVATEAEAAASAKAALKNSPVVTCGGEPSVIACLLNRDVSVRAAVITKTTNVVTLTTVMSPHAVCVDSSGWSFGDILKLLRSLSAACRPQGWREI